jgi:hypothetical protein
MFEVTMLPLVADSGPCLEAVGGIKDKQLNEGAKDY